MSLVINHNMMSMNATRNLNETYNRLSTSTRRLSSGLRVGTAADDAAGLAMRELMRADIQTLNQGLRNANDGISLIQTADGALQVIDAKLIRMKELAEQAATGTYTDAQRKMIDQEYQAMAAEITRISTDTDFNSLYLLRGTGQDNPAEGINLEAAKTAAEAAGLNTSYDDSGNLVITNSTAGTLTTTFDLNSGTGTVLTKSQAIDPTGSLTIAKDGTITPPDPITTVTAGVPAGRTYSDTATVEEWNGTAWVPVLRPANTAAGSNVRITDTLASGASLVDVYIADDATFSVGLAAAAGSAPVITATLNSVSSTKGPDDIVTAGVGATYDVTNNTVTVEQWDYTNSEWVNVPLGTDTAAGAAGDAAAGKPPKVRITEEFSNGSKRIDEYVGKDAMQLNVDAATGVLTVASAASDVTSVSSKDVFEVDIHFGSSNNASDHYSYQIEAMTAKSLGLGAEAQNDVLTAEHAKAALDAITAAITKKDEARANLGAMQNRLSATIENVSIQKENLQASESRISDVDVATEMTEFTRNQIMAQSAVSMLAQANSLPKMAQKLIDG